MRQIGTRGMFALGRETVVGGDGGGGRRSADGNGLGGRLVRWRSRSPSILNHLPSRTRQGIWLPGAFLWWLCWWSAVDWGVLLIEGPKRGRGYQSQVAGDVCLEKRKGIRKQIKKKTM